MNYTIQMKQCIKKLKQEEQNQQRLSREINRLISKQIKKSGSTSSTKYKLTPEEKLVSELLDKKWEQIFKKEKYKTIMLFSLGNIIKLYKKRELFTKKTILEICGYQILLKKK